MGEGDRVMKDGPSRAIESIVAHLVPPARREEVLGDLHERYEGPAQYLLDVLRTVPHVVASQIRRTTDPRLVIFEAFALYIAFLAAPAQPGGGSLIFKPETLLQALIPVVIALVVLRLIDAYSTAPRSLLMTLAQSALAVAISYGADELVRFEYPGLALPRAALLSGGVLALFVLWFLRSFVLGTGTVARPATLSAAGGRAVGQQEIQRGIERRLAALQGRNFVEGGSYLIGALCFGLCFFTGVSALIRVGAGLIVASMVFMAVQILLFRKRPIRADMKVSDPAMAYRAELARQRDFHRGAWLWSRLSSVVPGYILFCIGSAIASPPFARVMIATCALFFLAVLAAVPLNLQKARNYQKDIDRLDAASKASAGAVS
ncbi:MAG: hypothetical protein WBQ34_18420 [Candidatus Acidiferrales bacterium]